MFFYFFTVPLFGQLKNKEINKPSTAEHLNLEDDVGVPHNESLKDSFHREQKSVLLAMSVDASAPGSGMNDFCCVVPPLVGGAAEHW